MHKPISIKRIGKQNREKRVLLGLVDYYIRVGRPVGSNTLKETGFEDLSSATIRNYFARLEEEGYLSQPHASGGRIPTNLAYKTYAHAYLDSDPLPIDPSLFRSLRNVESKEIAIFLQESAETLSLVTNCAVFLSAPRFDQDFVTALKLVPLDFHRCLCVLITDFGAIQTEILYIPTKKLTAFMVKRIEAYFQWRLKGIHPSQHLDTDEEAIGQGLYNELMLRYIVSYSNFINEEIYRTGFSRLLTYSEFQETSQLASSLALFENTHRMRMLLKECMTLNYLKFWVGDDLVPYSATNPNCTVIAIPYYINQTAVGAVGILGPTRIPYRLLFSQLRVFSTCVSEGLARNVYKYKISFRQPEFKSHDVQKETQRLIGQSRTMLLEDKR